MIISLPGTLRFYVCVRHISNTISISTRSVSYFRNSAQSHADTLLEARKESPPLAVVFLKHIF